MINQTIKLRAEDKKKLEDLAPDISWLDGEIKRAERAGLDVSELREKFNKTKQTRLGVLREYG